MNLIEKLSASWGIEEYAIEDWLTRRPHSNLDVLDKVADLPKRTGAMIQSLNLEAQPYLLEYQGLLTYTWQLNIEMVRKLPQDIFDMHLANVQEADRTGKNSRLSDADTLIILRYAKRQADINFALKMYVRSISHSSYPSVLVKHSALALSLLPIAA